MNGLSEEDRKFYQDITSHFRQVREMVNAEIGLLEKQIQDKKNLLAEDKDKCRVPGAVKECENCGVMSMRYLGLEPSTFKPDLDDEREEYAPIQRYRCAICGHEVEERVFDFD